MSRQRRWAIRVALFSLLCAALLAFYAFGGRDLVSLAALKNARTALLAQVAEHPVRTELAYLAAFAGAIALCLPVGAIMTLAGGALFGWWKGAALATVASTTGATAAMLGGRLLAREWVRKRWPEAVARMDRGIERNGGTYLVSLRLAPGIPFVLINLGMGLTPMRPGRFALFTAAGGLPGAIVFASAGQALSRVNRMSDVLSPGMVAAFVGLSLLPLLGKALARWQRGIG